MNDSQIMKLVEDRIEELEHARNDLTALREENTELFDKFVQLTEIYNNNWDSIRNLLKEIASPDPVRIGSFSRDRKTTKVRYKPSLLPANVITAEGVVKEVDDKRIAELVAQGVLKQDEVEGAQYPYSKSPAVRSELKKAILPTLVPSK